MGDCDKFLNLLSICDAIHDFKTDYPKVKTSIDIILNGLKCRSIEDIDEKYIKYTEDSLIEECLGYKSMNYLIGDLESNRYTKDIEIFDKPYNIKLLHIRRGSIIKYLDRMTHIREEELIDFFGGETVSILYDAGINALKVFSTVNKQRLRINQVINREFMNDSATGKSTSEIETINQLIDTEEDPIVYDKSSMFNTKYILTLNKLNIDRLKQMDIHFTIKDKQELLYESHHNSWNTRPSCIEYLEKSKYKNDVIYQIKRSGDWLQALSCLDIMREYNDKKENLDKIILMTFDRVLLIYALFLGLDVLFTSKDQEVIYFKSKITSAPQVRIPLPIPISKNKLEIPYHYRLETYLKELEEARDTIKSDEEQTNKILNELDIKREKDKYDTWWYSNIIKIFRFLLRKIREIKEYFSNIAKSNGSAYMAPQIEPIPDIPLYIEILNKSLAQKGGSIKLKKLCNDYLTELKLSIECFDSEENPDYGYYEKTALIVLSCLNEYRISTNVYEQMQAIFFDILPSIEGYIKCKEPEIQQFFGKDEYTADCTAYAARNIALHSIGLRTGKLESLGNREKHSVKIPPTAVKFYKKIEKHLEKSTFEERKEWIIQQLQVYHVFLHFSKSKKSSTRKISKKKSSTRKLSVVRLLTAKGGSRSPKHFTRRKSRQ